MRQLKRSSWLLISNFSRAIFKREPPRRSNILGHACSYQKGTRNLERRASTLANTNLLTKMDCGTTLIKSPHSDIEVPEISFTEYIFTNMDQFKHNVILVDHVTSQSWTGEQLKDRSVHVASGLRRLGYKKGDILMIFATNCPEYAMLFLACGALGVIVTTANPIYTPGELAGQLLHSEATAIVTMPSMMKTVKEALDSSRELSTQIKRIIVIGEADGYLPFSKLLEDDGKYFPESLDVNPREDLLVMPFSSGTTGLPKGVELTHYNIIANLQQMAGGAMPLEADRDCLVGLLPFYHIYGMVVVQFSSLVQGAKLVVLPRFEPEMFMSAIEQHKITYMHLVPPIVLFLAKHTMVGDYKMDTLKTIICGAAPLGGGVTKEVCDRLNIGLLQGYGLTESSPLTHIDQYPPKLGTVGRLLSSTVAKIVHPDTGKSVGPGEEGELLIKGPQLMKGYLKNPDATSSTIKNGWLHTGDLGYVDHEGYFTISDRMKELIKYKGLQIAPAELEHVLCTHPDVQDAAVVGVPAGEGLGDVPCAFVVMKSNRTKTAEELQQFVADRVAPYKKLRGGMEFVGEIPKTASGKILRRHLRK